MLPARIFNQLSDFLARGALSAHSRQRFFTLLPKSTVREGSVAPPRRSHLLIVCQGNICRSPYASLVMRHELELRGLGDSFQVSSAGLQTELNKPADPIACSVAESRGVRLSEHRTQPLTRVLIDKADIVFLMEPFHALVLLGVLGSCLRKTVLLGAFSPQPRLTIADPYGKDETVFREIFDQIDLCVKKLVDELARPFHR